MDYKQKYEQALKNINKIKTANKDNKELVDFIEFEYPELKDTEDERIRKELIEYLKRRLRTSFNQEVRICKDGIAYLEKQGEQKPVPDDELSDFESALFSAFSDAWQEYLSGKEVNVAKWTREHSAELLEVARKQKPTWSEEDEEAFRCLEYTVKRYYNDKDTINKYCSWLKSLKNKVQPQSNQGWSEEDEISLGDALWAIERARTIAKDENDMGNLWYAENWLKSIKERIKEE